MAIDRGEDKTKPAGPFYRKDSESPYSSQRAFRSMPYYMPSAPRRHFRYHRRGPYFVSWCSIAAKDECIDGRAPRCNVDMQRSASGLISAEIETVSAG